MDKKDAGVCVDARRSRFSAILLSLLGEGVITVDDLEGFSDGFRESVERSARILGLLD